MIEWLGIEHLFALSPAEKILGFFTPLIVYVAFMLVQLLLPAKRVQGYVTDPKTGDPIHYRLNGLIVYFVMTAVWWFELTGVPRDWFYRSTIFAVIGGTCFTTIFSVITFYSQAKENRKNPIKAFWTGAAREITLFNGRIDMKMYFYLCGGTMLAINAMSGAWYHYQLFGENSNPGVFLFTAFFVFYILDYCLNERVTLYTYDLMHEGVGLKLFWGGLVCYGWMFTMPLWGLAVYPNPEFDPFWNMFLMIGSSVLFLVGWAISRGANLQKYTFKRWPERSFLGIKPKYIPADDRKILISGFWGVARHFSYFGEAILGVIFAIVLGYFTNLWAWTYGLLIIGMCIFRERSDDGFCEQKYGSEAWGEYRRLVKYRIIPGVY